MAPHPDPPDDPSVPNDTTMVTTPNAETLPVPDKPEHLKQDVSKEKHDTKKKSKANSKPPAASRKPSIKYSITNLLQTSSAPHDLTVPQAVPPPPEPKPVGVYFNNIKIKSRIEVNKGSFHTIDVQSDMRFITYYLQYTSLTSFPELVVDQNPYVSLASLIGYKLILFNAHQLILDLKCRHEKSTHSLFFEDSTRMSSFVNTLMNCRIPHDLSTELQQMAPVLDPLRPDLEYIPSLACFNLPIDFGRSIPGYIYFLIHNLLADVTNFTSTLDLINEIYLIDFLRIGEENYSISNLFGGPFQHNNVNFTHNNWFRKSFEETFMPLFGYCLSENPTLIDLPLLPAECHDVQNFNAYVYQLLGSIRNITNVEIFMQSINRYLSASDPSLPTLGSFYSKVSGMTILTHSIESATLPTWHSFVTQVSSSKTKVIDDSKFATAVLFCASPLKYTDKLKVPTKDSYEPKLYQVETKKFSPKSTPVPYATFSKSSNVTPDVLWFQPYSRGTGLINHSLVLGLKIEQAEFDGVSIPIPNPELTLINQNSEYYQGSIPIANVIPTLTMDGQVAFRFRERTTHDDYEPISFNRRDVARAVRPYFANEAVSNRINGDFPFTSEHNHDDLSAAVTYCQWSRNLMCKEEENSLYLWTSYRTIDTLSGHINLYYTLRGMYGTNTVLSQTRHPSVLLPK